MGKVTIRGNPRSTIFEEKGELKRNRTDVCLLTSPTPYYRLAKPVHMLNPFTPCLPHRHPKNYQFEIIKHVKGLLQKCTVLKVDLLQTHQICCLRACMCARFSPKKLRTRAVKGLIRKSFTVSYRVRQFIPILESRARQTAETAIFP